MVGAGEAVEFELLLVVGANEFVDDEEIDGFNANGDPIGCVD